MKISKYGYACLLVEDNGKRLLIDPGSYSFDDKYTPESLGPMDALIVTHQHADHYMPDILKSFQKLKPCPIISGAEIKDLALKEGLAVDVLPLKEDCPIAGFTLKAFAAEHGPIPGVIPENIAYLVNGRLLHPGDSYATEDLPRPELLALPTQSPWGRLVDTIQYAETLKPKRAFAIHNSFFKDGPNKASAGFIAQILAESGIEFQSLEIGESWEG